MHHDDNPLIWSSFLQMHMWSEYNLDYYCQKKCLITKLTIPYAELIKLIFTV